MKRIYITLSALAFVGISWGQNTNPVYTFSKKQNAEKVRTTPSGANTPTSKPNTQTEKVLNVLWTENFEGSATALTTTNGTYTTSGSNPNYWTLRSTHPVNFSNPENLSGKFLAWDSYTPNSTEPNFATTAVDGAAISPDIDLSAGAANGLVLSFKTDAMYCCNYQETPFGIQISELGGAPGSWSSTIPLDFNIDRNVATSDFNNPLEYFVDITAYTTAFSANTRIKFIWEAMNVDPNGQINTHYYWLVDDIQIYENPNYNLEIASSYWGTAGLNYFQIPITQTAPIDYTLNVNNTGAMSMTNVQLNLDVNSGAFVGSSAPVTISAGAADSLVLTTPFTPSALGTYLATRTLTSTEVDEVPVNNTLPSLSFDVTNYIYARDNGVIVGSSTNGVNGHETGNLFDIFTDQTLRGISVRLRGGAGQSVTGTEFFVKIYSVDPATGDFVWVGESNPMLITATNVNTNLVVPLVDPAFLTAGTTYLAVCGSFTSGLSIANAGTSDPQTTFTLDMSDGTWYYQTETPYVRLNFDPSLSLEENSTSLTIGKVFPNPTSGETTINYSLANASTVNVEVVDITGKIVYTLNNGTEVAGAHNLSFNAASFSNGVYYVTISTDEATVTKKFIKK